jgi:hypothetical protein
MRLWLEATLAKQSAKSDTAAIRYALSRWRALTRYVDDGQLEIDNNAAERTLRVVALGRKKLSLRRLRLGRRTGCSHVLAARFSQTQRPRPRELSRPARAKPLLDSMRLWLGATLAKQSAKSDTRPPFATRSRAGVRSPATSTMVS